MMPHAKTFLQAACLGLACAARVLLADNSAPTNLTLSASSVFENQPTNTVIGFFTAQDPDAGDTATFTLVPGTGDTDNASFAILNGTNLVTTAVFDYEATNSYTIRVRATDAGGLFFEQPFTITITDVNDPPSGTSKTVRTTVDTPYTFTAADFGFSDIDIPANNFMAVKITSLPTAGTLTVAGVPVNAGDYVAPEARPAGVIWSPHETNRYWWSVASSTDGTKLIASESSGQLYTSTDSGTTWTAHETNRGWHAVASSADGTKLVAAEYSGYIYTSSDSGTNWAARGSSRYWSSVASSADGTRLVAVVGDYGFHSGQIYISSDSGTNWTARDTNRYWGAVASSADGLKLVAVESGADFGSGGRIYISTDAGVTWTARETNRHWRAVASSADGVKLIAAVNGGRLFISTDSGTNWVAREGYWYWNSVASSTDGTKLVAVDRGSGSSGGRIYISADSGMTWTSRESSRRWFSVASSADGSKLVALANGSQIYTSSDTTPLVFTPAASALGVPYTSFTFQVQDDGGTASGGVDLDSVPKTMTINVTVPNHAPAGADSTVTMQQDTIYNFSAADFGFVDSGDTPPNNLLAVKVTSLPAGGTLSVNGVPVNVGDVVPEVVNPSGTVWTRTIDGQNWVCIASSADGKNLVAAGYPAAAGYPPNDAVLYTSTDFGATWLKRYLFYSSSMRWLALASSADGTRLVAASAWPDSGLYVSSDSGWTWIKRKSSTTDWASVASSADGTKLVAVEGGNLSGYIYTSTDSGTNWTARGSRVPWSAVASSADGAKLVAVTQFGNIFTSADSGVTWVVRLLCPYKFTSVASTADGTKLVAVCGGGPIYISVDSGTNWTSCGEMRYWSSVASSADGTRLVAVVGSAPFMAARTGQIYISTDFGLTWIPQESDRRWTCVASSADGLKLVAGDYNGAIYTSSVIAGLAFTPAALSAGSPYASFTFQVQDDGGTANGGVDLASAANTMTVNVTPNSAPTNIILSASSIAENSTNNTFIGSFSVSDPDLSDTATFAFTTGAGGTDNYRFTLSNGTNLLAGQTFNYESKSNFTIRVRATDAGGLFTEQPFTIYVIDVNEAPTNLVLSATNVAENQPIGTVVGALSATDRDAGDTLTFTLVPGTGGDDNATFAIAGSNLVTAAVFDYETKSSYSIRVRATDTGGLFTENVFTVTVTDLPEWWPQRLALPELTAGGLLRLAFSNDAGGLMLTNEAGFYAVETTTNLGGTNWLPFTNSLTFSNGALLLEDADATNFPARFYRVIRK